MEKTQCSFFVCIIPISLFALLSVFFMEVAHAQAPYCAPSHTVALCPKYDMFIGGIRIEEGTKVIYEKANDGCNKSSAPNYTLMSTSPAFSLYEGCDYKMFISTGKLYNVQVGVWVDLNMDNDFSDSGEFLSKGWTEINSDGQLHSRSFQIRCGVITTGTTRMRIRTDSAGSAKWDSAGACTSVKYGETEDYTITINKYVKPLKGFTMPDTVFVGIPFRFTNNHQGCFSSQWDIQDDGSTEYTTVNPYHVFNLPGRYCVRLKTSSYCGIREDYNYCFNVLAPATITDFLTNSNLLQIYPNPSTGMVNIYFNSLTSGNIGLEVYNSFGVLLMETKAVSLPNGLHVIDLSNRASGLYTLRINADGKQFNRMISIYRRNE